MMDWWRRQSERRRLKREASRKKGPKDHWLREALETIATAVIMALIVRHYAVEAFKIPTESMAPTLLGDRYGGGTGDRILVNKWPLYFRGPLRWRIDVFRYPLNTSTNYVKRLVGLGGEHLQIRDGDIWTDGSIERKPRNVQDAVWKNFYPESVSKDIRAHAWQSLSWAQSGSTFEVKAGDETGVLYLGAPVLNALHVNPNGREIVQNGGIDPVGDVRLTATVEMLAGDGWLEIVIQEHGREFAVKLSPAASSFRLPGRVVPIDDFTFERGRSYEVAFANVDDALDLVIDGEPVARLEYDTTGDAGDNADQNAVRILARNARLTVSDLRVDRDIHYTGWNDGHYLTDIKIPDGHYVMMGDNSNNSKDSRLWVENVFLLKDGTVRIADPLFTDPATGRTRPNFDRFVENGQQFIRFVDVQGIDRIVALDDLDGAPTSRGDGLEIRNAEMVRYRDGSRRIARLGSVQGFDGGFRFTDETGTVREARYEDLVIPHYRHLRHAPFVRRDQLLGEAFFIFWPMSPWRLRLFK